MRSTALRACAALLALVLVTAACGDDDDAADGATQSTTSLANDMPAAPGDDVATADIVDTAVAAGDFSTLVTAVQAAGLEETLRGPGPFTVFAPTDAAFEALPEGTLDSLLQDPTGQLADILTYHVLADEVQASDVVMLDGQEVATVNGASFTVNVDGDAVTLTDAAGNDVAVTATDVMASNGVIHVIDAVLMP
jgi:uncharacterized surface protein with fasciclin (FAS1) repeats